MKIRVPLFLFLFALLLFLLSVCARSASVNMTIIFHNVGTNDWNAGVSLTEQFVNPGSAYQETENPLANNYDTDAVIAAGASHSVYFPGDSSPIYGPSVAPSLQSAYFWTTDASGPTWPSHQAPTGLSSSWSGSGSDILTCSIYVDVNTNHYGVIADCFTNVTVYLNDDWTNDIVVTFTNAWRGTWQFDVSGPLVAYPYGPSSYPCTNQGISWTYSNVPPCISPVVFNVTNGGSWRVLAAKDNNAPSNPQQELLVAPGATYNYSNSVPCAQASGWSLWSSGMGGDDSLSNTGITNMYSVPPGTSEPGSLTSGTGGTGGTGGMPGQFTNAPPVNNDTMLQFTNGGITLPGGLTNVLPVLPPVTSGIVWQSTNTDLSQMVGVQMTSGNAIFNAVATSAQQAHSDASTAAAQSAVGLAGIQGQSAINANGIIAAINSASSLNHSDNGALGSGINNVNQNILGASGMAHNDAGSIVKAIGDNAMTNYNLESSQQKVLGALAGISNLLAATNGTVPMTNSGYTYPDYATNAESALAMAASIEDQSGVSDFVGSMTPNLPSDTPEAVGMTMTFCGTSIDLDPIHRFPAAVEVSYQGFKLVSLLSFFLAVGALYWKLIAVKASTVLGNAPEMDVEILGFGGNILGVIAGKLIATAFIGVFAAAMVYLFDNIGASIGDAMNVVAFTSPMTGVGLYLLTSLMPVRLMFSLACTLILLNFTLGKIVALAVTASRFLGVKIKV